MMIQVHLTSSIIVTIEAIKAPVKFLLMQWVGETNSLDAISLVMSDFYFFSYASCYVVCNNKLTYFFMSLSAFCSETHWLKR